MASEKIVACDGCGSVYEMTRVGDFIGCPTCDHTTFKRTPVPGIGRVNKWWSKVAL